MPVPSKTRDAWYRLPRETTKAFKAFCVYRDLGPVERSTNAAYRKLRGIEASNKPAPGFWSDWSKRYRWVERAAAFDDHEAEIGQQAREKRMAKLAEMRVDFEFERQVAAQRRIGRMDVVLDKYEEEAKMSVRDVAQRKIETVGGKPVITETKFKAIKGGDYAKVAMVQSVLEMRAVNGLHSTKDPLDDKEEPITRIEYAWVPRVELSGETSNTILSPASSGSTNALRDGKDSAGPSDPVKVVH